MCLLRMHFLVLSDCLEKSGPPRLNLFVPHQSSLVDRSYSGEKSISWRVASVAVGTKTSNQSKLATVHVFHSTKMLNLMSFSRSWIVPGALSSVGQILFVLKRTVPGFLAQFNASSPAQLRQPPEERIATEHFRKTSCLPFNLQFLLRK